MDQDPRSRSRDLTPSTATGDETPARSLASPPDEDKAARKTESPPTSVADGEKTARTPPQPASSGTSAPAPLTAAEEAKVEQILRACESQDLLSLIDYASTSGGFVNDEARRVAWPILLGCSGDPEIESPWQDLPVQQYERQIGLDVDRSFVYYPKHQTEKELAIRKGELSDLIVSVLRQNPFLHYFQGYHDIVQVFLLVLGPTASREPVTRLSLVRIRDFMQFTLAATKTHYKLLPDILFKADPELCRRVSDANPSCALAALLTLYAHAIREYSEVTRLFDFLLAHEASMSIYLFAAIILARREDILTMDPDEPDMIHVTVANLPQQPLELEQLIEHTMVLFKQHKPCTLPWLTWFQVSRYSVLKTTQDLQTRTSQCLGEARQQFTRHESELKFFEDVRKRYTFARLQLKKHRSSAKVAGLTAVVVVVAWWLAKSGSQPAFLRAFGGSMLLEPLRRISSFFRATRLD
ncbi:rab-GTPase-TBC domain-containing protein [Lineolata rhizophorae]|uniref:Rab-GTPase-TBC domain-containing protein n=1 Tax=Lineolata rhizophorae TaxID=578093 RepID=A0A6A6NYQ7_9PEZI|nr:rab-GTPase-TBC domain-containing protein [Lineolata rhizophorae]